MNVKPNYEQRQFYDEGKNNQLQTVVAPKDKLEGDALPISQQAYIYRTTLSSNNSVSLKLKEENNGFYIFNVDGSLSIAEEKIEKRDAIGIYDIDTIDIKANEDSEVIIIEVPMI